MVLILMILYVHLWNGSISVEESLQVSNISLYHGNLLREDESKL